MTAEPHLDEQPVRFGSRDLVEVADLVSTDDGPSAALAGGGAGVPACREPAGAWTPTPTCADLTTGRSERPSPDVPEQGWRGLLYRLTRLNPGLSPAERDLRAAVAQTQVPFAGPRHVLFANPKGGAGKTTACLGVAATFGLHRGRGVVAFDNNPTRGTLGLRAQPDRHTRTVTDLLADLERVRQIGDLSAYLRSQPASHFDVLASDDDPRMAVSRGEDDYLAVIGVLDTYYNLICIDTGNDVTAPVFTAAVRSADQLVVVTGPSWDSAYSASWMLDHLEQHGEADLVRHAVTVVTLPPGRAAELPAVEEHFARRTRAVVQVPFDAALDAGTEIHLGALRPDTRRAWLELAARIADRFPTTTARTLTTPEVS